MKRSLSRDKPHMIYYIRLYKNKRTFYKKCTRAILFHFHALSSQSLISFCALCTNSAEAWNSFFSYSVMCIRMTCVMPCSPIAHGRDRNSSLHTSWWPWRETILLNARKVIILAVCLIIQVPNSTTLIYSFTRHRSRNYFFTASDVFLCEL